MTLSIIILSYNKPHLVTACLESLFAHYEKELGEKEVEIIVVDNASEKENVSQIKEFIKKAAQGKFVQLIENDTNYGFGKGNNIGFEKTHGEYILFLNSDIEVRDKGFLGMASFLEKHPSVGILGGKLINTDGSLQHSAMRFYTQLNVLLMLVGAERLGLVRSSPSATAKVDWVSGACMMIRSEVFKKIGEFDEKIFMYLEDMEICYRAKLQGFTTYFYPDISVIHIGQGSSNRTFAIVHIYESLLYFYKKHKPTWQYILVTLLLKLKARVAIFIGILSGNTYLVTTYRQAVKVNA